MEQHDDKFKEQVVKECQKTGNIPLVARRHLHGRMFVNRLSSAYVSEKEAIAVTAEGIFRLVTRLEYSLQDSHRHHSPLLKMGNAIYKMA